MEIQELKIKCALLQQQIQEHPTDALFLELGKLVFKIAMLQKEKLNQDAIKFQRLFS